VISFDQMGPVSLRPTAGSGWAAKGRPERQRADYNRRSGIRYVFGAYEVHADRLRVKLRPKRAGSDMLTFMRTIRLAYPSRQWIYWIQDNLSANWVPAIREYAAANRIELSRPTKTERPLARCVRTAQARIVAAEDGIDPGSHAFQRHLVVEDPEAPGPRSRPRRTHLP